MESDTLDAAEALAAQGATAPRVSLQNMKDKIVSEQYLNLGEALFGVTDDPAAFPHPTYLITICALTMANGFTVIGKSAPASAENFDAEKGRKFAFDDAINQLWPLEGYSLRDRLAAA